MNLYLHPTFMNSSFSILQKYWQHNSFRPLQEEIIQSVLEGKDTLALLPTGGGKSLCFQIPAMMKDGLCLVITPLVALMKDQVNNLGKKNISALALHSGMSFYEVKKALENAIYGNFKFLYLSPERLETNLFKEYLSALNINLIAVDEAHCISQWGYDFRPPYLRIANLRKELPNVPLLALTASATTLVQNDIVQKLHFQSYNIFRQSFERSNISYSVFKVNGKINKLIEILQNVSGSSIVYCKSRKLTKEVSQLLTMQNISANFYHAGLASEERNKKQNAWINNETRVMVCTNAFGMGIDKPDVRTVIHYDMPDCLENYYQEAGRAGRDEKKAYAVLLYQLQDYDELKDLPDKRFPLIQHVRKVYQALADYLQVPVGLGEDNYYDFDLNEFVKNFKLDIFLVINALKVLEQEGHLTFNENIFLPSKINFVTGKNLLNEFEKNHPQFEAIIKCLLRTYEGIFDHRISIFEKQIAKLCRTTEAIVKDELKQLRSFNIIEYLPQKETPQIHFLLNRAPAKFLSINQENYLKRKQQFTQRTEMMLKYLQLQKNCRSKFIAIYFGDNSAKDCGICDNCLQQKNRQLSAEEFKKIEQKIYDQIGMQSIPVKELLHCLKEIKKENTWKVLKYLQNERRIKIDEKDLVKKV
ncbi:MAG: RecQ family ATP-dependent DNA helicase [Chitinophagaceae bacterium]